jgi:hypothetical protein
MNHSVAKDEDERIEAIVSQDDTQSRPQKRTFAGTVVRDVITLSSVAMKINERVIHRLATSMGMMKESPYFLLPTHGDMALLFALSSIEM